MSTEAVPVSVRILDKEYRVACPPSEQAELVESARILDQRMREIRQTGRVVGADRIAVMAALNIAHELLLLQKGHSQGEEDLAQRLHGLQQRVGEALAAQPHLDAPQESV